MPICGPYAFSGSSFSDRKKPNVFFFFDLKKAQCVVKHPEFQNLKKIPVRKQPNFKIFKKEKLLSLLLEYTALDVVLCQVLPVSEQL